MLFYQPEHGYCFNSDSIFLYDFASTLVSQGRLLDVAAGVGVIGLLLARDSGLSLTMVEKQKVMADLARINAKINHIQAQIFHEDFLCLEADAFEEGEASYGSKKGAGRFDIIVSNPPFYHRDVLPAQSAHLHTCRSSTHLPLLPMLKQCKRFLSPRGWLVFCYDASQLTEVTKAIEGVGLRIEKIRFVHPKKERAAKLVMVAARNQSKARTTVAAPLIVHEDGGFSKEVETIFQKARTHTIKCQISI